MRIIILYMFVLSQTIAAITEVKVAALVNVRSDKDSKDIVILECSARENADSNATEIQMTVKSSSAGKVLSERKVRIPSTVESVRLQALNFGSEGELIAATWEAGNKYTDFVVLGVDDGNIPNEMLRGRTQGGVMVLPRFMDAHSSRLVFFSPQSNEVVAASAYQLKAGKLELTASVSGPAESLKFRLEK